MNISVIGAGYVGLVTGTCLADLGMNVVCVDNNEDVINNLKNFEVPFYEPGLQDLIKKNCKSNNLSFTTNTSEAVKNSEIIFISVGTPVFKDGLVDLRYVYNVANDIAHSIDGYKLIIVKSTVPIGTCVRVKDYISNLLKDFDKEVTFDIASNPEFLREGTAINDFNYPDRIVIGTQNNRAAELMKNIYDAPVFKDTPFIFTTIETSEMIKYASNAFLATKISFINEISNICELCGSDITVVSKAMGLDKRIGEKFLNPGPGFGGSCFPKDTRALIKIGEDFGYKPNIIKSVIKSNHLQQKRSVQKIKNVVGELKGKTFTVLGLSFKPETSDVRESSSIYIIDELLKEGANVKAYDPKASENFKKFYPHFDITYCNDELSACQNSDCIVIATEWGQFKNLDYQYIKSIVNNPVIIDLRNIFEPSYIKEMGFIYKGIGKP